MKTKYIIFLLLVIFAFAACSDSKHRLIDIVKNGLLDVDRGTTIGMALDGYKYFDNKEWKVVTTDNGRRFVVFTAFYNYKLIKEESSYNYLRRNANVKGQEMTFEFKISESNQFELYSISNIYVYDDHRGESTLPLSERSQEIIIKSIYNEMPFE